MVTSPLPSIPGGLSRLREHPEGAAWLRRLPDLLQRARTRWDLELAPPFTAGSAAWTCLARRRGEQGWDLVLKISFPHDEARLEAEALLHWHGHGTPRLVEAEPADWALLMRALTPGTPLAAAGLETSRALRAGARVLSELHAVPVPPAAPFPRLTETMAAWEVLVHQRAAQHSWAPTDHPLLGEFSPLVRALLERPHREVLLHGDANPGNLLGAEEEHRLRWYAIDPKPLIGDPAYDPWPLLEQVGPDVFAGDGGGRAGEAGPANALLERANLVAELLASSAWAIIAWAFVRHVESILWLTAGTPAPQQHPDSAAADALRRQWRQARHWHAALLLAGPPAADTRARHSARRGVER